MRLFARRLRTSTLPAALVLLASPPHALSAGLSDQQVFADPRDYIVGPVVAEPLPDDGFLLESIDAAKLSIETLLEEQTYDPLEFAAALTTLAEAQRRAGHYDASLENYGRSVELIADGTNYLSGSLIRPLQGLARAHRDRGDLDTAAEVFERALHVHQVNHGLYRLDQSEMLLEASELHIQRGDTAAALTLLEHNVAIARRNFPDDPMSTLPALYARADMLSRTGDNMTSQKKYRRIIDLIEDEAGKRSVELLPALHRIADVFLYNEISDGYKGAQQAKRYLRRAILIAERSPDASAIDKADAHIAMGDYLMLKSLNVAAAARSYRTAWDVLSADEDLAAARDQRFGNPTALNDVPSNTAWPIVSMRRSAERSADPNGFVVLAYDVAENGRVDNVEVLQSEPGGQHDAAVANHLQGLVFRPRFIDGLPQLAGGNRFEIRFEYTEDGRLATEPGDGPPVTVGTGVSTRDGIVGLPR